MKIICTVGLYIVFASHPLPFSPLPPSLSIYCLPLSFYLSICLSTHRSIYPSIFYYSPPPPFSLYLYLPNTSLFPRGPRSKNGPVLQRDPDEGRLSRPSAAPIRKGGQVGTPAALAPWGVPAKRPLSTAPNPLVRRAASRFVGVPWGASSRGPLEGLKRACTRGMRGLVPGRMRGRLGRWLCGLLFEWEFCGR